MNTILIVDDEESIRENLDLRLRANKYNVLTASNGRQAVEIVKKNRPDLILLDVMMPEMDGFATCEQIKKDIAPAFIPVLMLTALNNTEEKVKGLQVGADDFISKPYDEKELLARIGAFLRIKSLHDQLEDSHRKLKELEAAKHNLTALIVHDLKSPIASIFASIGIFRGKHKDLSIPAVDELITKVKRNGQIQLDLISDILEISSMENKEIQLKKEKIRVPALIKECFAQVQPSADQKKIALNEEFDEKIPDMYVDDHFIHRIIINLLNNSFKYTPRNGSVTVKVLFDRGKKEHIVTVQDTGIGIAEENLAKIFDPFFQVDPVSDHGRRSVGLGLSFCRIAVESHGGKIWAESKKDEGTSFHFSMPEG